MTANSFPHDLTPTLSPMHADDIPAVMAIEAASFPTPWSAQTYANELENRHASYWVVRPATPGDRADVPPILAYAGLWLLGEEAHVTTIATHPAWRRRHVGEWLLLRMLGVARAGGVDEVTLEVRVGNVGAIALYRKLGFEVVGRRKSYYRDTGEDARLLTFFAVQHPAVWRRVEARLTEIEG